ncbi:Sec-independent protein translocase protein TatB [Corynebacterium lactis]|uniref:Sec-independent protein translocase protein TatB n=1 Tax=Corynebacterium lactis RW2-5 TaxID=1408189 RepID=A0A0K2GZD9_9CORY|nr:Sec-independent protein translocase protein TatB [Corynebacterium lactis]ALA67053.1 translocase [Corynebacterium lactis RW2-5]
MFSNVGWGEILVLFLVGLVIVGPERLPKLVQDARAMLLAARTAINDARENLSGEFGEDFDDLRKPLQELNELRRLNPKTAITRTLFDGDDTYLDMLSGKPAVGGGAQPQQPAQPTAQAQPQAGHPGEWQNPVAQAQAQQNQAAQNQQPGGVAKSPWLDDDIL